MWVNQSLKIISNLERPAIVRWDHTYTVDGKSGTVSEAPLTSCQIGLPSPTDFCPARARTVQSVCPPIDPATFSLTHCIPTIPGRKMKIPMRLTPCCARLLLYASWSSLRPDFAKWTYERVDWRSFTRVTTGLMYGDRSYHGLWTVHTRLLVGRSIKQSIGRSVSQLAVFP